MQGSNEDTSPKGCTVLSHTPPDMLGPAFLGSQFQQHLREIGLPVLGHIKKAEILTYDLPDGISFDPFHSLVPGEDGPILVEQDDGHIGDLFDHLLVELLQDGFFLYTNHNHN